MLVTQHCQDSYRYDPWGNVISSTGTLANPLRYTSREYDAESGLYFYRARYYDPQVGRFISRDPKGIQGGLNLYAYVGNHPTNATDALGLDDDSGPIQSDYTPFGGWQLGVHLRDDHLQFSANGDRTGFTNWEGDLSFGGPKLTCTIGNDGKWQLGGGFENDKWSLSGTAGPGGWQGEVDLKLGWGKVGVQGSGDYSGGYNFGVGVTIPIGK